MHRPKSATYSSMSLGDARRTSLVTWARGCILACALALSACGGNKENPDPPEPDNTPPTARAGGNQTVNPGQPVTLDGSNSSDAEGGALSFVWRLTPNRDDVRLSDARVAEPTFTAPSAAEDTPLVFTLTVTDAEGLVGTPATVTITINAPPTANAGGDDTVNPGDAVTLDGSGSTDPGDGDLDYAWVRSSTGGPDITLSGADTAAPTFTAPIVTTNTDYAFTLTVTDGNKSRATADVTITVNAPPTARAGDDATVSVGALVTLDGSASSDPGGGTLEYSWVPTAGSGITPSGDDTATPTFTAPAVTANADYTFTLTVTDDNDARDTDAVTITVNVPPMARVGVDQNVASNAMVALDGSSSSDTGGSEVRFAWKQTEGPSVTLNDDTIANPIFTAPTVQEQTTLVFELTVTDEDGGTDTVTMRVVVAATGSTTPPNDNGGGGDNGGDDNGGGDNGGDDNGGNNGGGNNGGDDNGGNNGGDDNGGNNGGGNNGGDDNGGNNGGDDNGGNNGGDDNGGNNGGNNGGDDNGGNNGGDDNGGNNGGGNNGGNDPMPANQAPVASVKEIDTVNPGDTVTLDGSDSTDPDGDDGKLEYSWQTPSGSDIALSDADAAMATFVAPLVTQDTDLLFTLTVTDERAAASTAQVTITVNAPPTMVSAGVNQRVNSGASVSLLASGSDPGGGDVKYSWALTSGPDVSLSNPTSTTPTFVTATTTADIVYVFTLTVTDEHDAASTAQVTIFVNAPPTARAGADQSVGLGATVRLDGSGSSDSGGGNIEYSWVLTSNPTPTLDALTPEQTSAASFTFTVPTVSATTTYVFSLTVTDRHGVASEPDTVSIEALANRPPTVSAAGPTEAVNAGDTVTLDGSGSIDPESETLTYAWVQTSGPVVSLEDAAAESTEFTVPTGILDTTFTFELTVTDPRGLGAKGTAPIAVAGDTDMHSVGGLDGSHEGPVHGISLSADGNLAVSGGLDGTVRLWNAPAGAEIRFDDGSGGTRTLGQHVGAVYAVAINGDGTRAISGGEDGILRLWNTDRTDTAGYGTEVTYGTGHFERSLGRRGIWIYAVALNRDGTRAVSGGFDGVVRLWNTATTGNGAGAEIERFGSETTDRSLGHHLHTESDGGTPNDDSDDITHPVSVYAVAMSDTGNRVISGGADGVVRVWDTMSGAMVDELTDDDAMGPVFDVDISSDGTMAVSGSADNHVHVWNVSGTNTGTERAESRSNGTYGRLDVTSVALSGDDATLIAGLADGTMMRLDNLNPTSGILDVSIGSFTHSDYIWSVATSRDGVIRASASNDGRVVFWDTNTPPDRHTNVGTSTVQEIVPSGGNANWRGIDVTVQELTGHPGRIRSVSLQADGSFLASADDAGEVLLWDVGSATVTRAAERRSDITHRDARYGSVLIRDAAVSADGRLIATGGVDNRLRLWHRPTGDLLYRSPWNQAHDDDSSDKGRGNILGVALTPDGSVALTTAVGGRALLWNTDAQTFQELERGSGTNAHASDAWGAALSADGSIAVTGGDDNVVRVWNTQTPVDADVRTLRDDPAGQPHAITDITSVAVSADGRTIVAGSKDGGTSNTTTSYVRAWRFLPGVAAPSSGRMVRRHTDEVLGVAVSGDGRIVLSGGRDNTVRLWNVSTGKLLRTMRGHDNDITGVTMSADGRIAASGDLGHDVYAWRIGRGHAGAPPRATAVARAGKDSLLSDGDIVTLDASGSSGAVAYHWRQTGGPRSSTSPVLSDVANDPARTVATLLGSGASVGPATLKLELAVTDGAGLVTTDEVSIPYRNTASHIDREIHADSIARSVAVSRDGTRAVSGGTDGEVHLLLGNLGSSIATLASHDGEVYAVAISDDGARAISGGSDGKVRFHDTVAENEITYADDRSLGEAGIWVYAVALSGNGLYAASAGFDGKVRFYNTRTGEEKVRFGSETTDRSLGDHGQSSVYAIAMSADGSRVISGGADGKGYLWDADTGAKICELEDDDDMGPIFAVDLGRDGTFAVTGGADNNVHTWNIVGTDDCPELNEYDDAVDADVTGVALNNGETKLAVSWANGRVKIVSDLSSRFAGRSRTAHSDYVWSIALRGDDDVLFSAGADGFVRLWDTAKAVNGQSFTSTPGDAIDVDTTIGDVVWGALDGTGDHGASTITGVAITADGSRALSAAEDARVVLWNLETGTFVRQMERSAGNAAHISRATNVAMSADGSVAASLGTEGDDVFTDSHLRIWNVGAGTQHESIEDDVGITVIDHVAVAISANGNRVMIGEKKAVLPIFSSDNGKIRMRVWNWNGSALADAYAGGNDIGESVGEARQEASLNSDHPRGINAVALNGDGSIAMSGAYRSDDNLRFWDVNAATNRRIHAVSTGNDVAGVALSDDGVVGVSGHGASTNSIRIWDRSGNMVTERSVPGMNQGGNVRGVAVSGDARLILSGGEGGTLKLWDAATGAEVRNLKQTSGHGDSHINAVSLTAIGGTAFTGGDGGKLFRWHIGRSRPAAASSNSGSGPPSLTGAAHGATFRSRTAPATRADCAAFGGGNGGLVRGQVLGANCVYPASLFGADNPLETNVTIPALPGGGAHVFEHSLVVGSAAASDPESPPVPGTGQGAAPTLTIEAGAVLAFEGASSALVVNPGARLSAVGTAARPITLTSRSDAQSSDAFEPWAGVHIHGNANDPHHLEFVVVKATAGDADIGAGSRDAVAIALHNVGGTATVRNLQVYAAAGDGLALYGGSVRVENFVSAYARGNSIDIGADWSGALDRALVIQPEHGGEHCLLAGGGASGKISGLTCITSSHTGTDASGGLGAGIHIGAHAAPTIERAIIVGSFADDADDRLNYCLRIDNRSPQAAIPALTGNIFACEDKAGGALSPGGSLSPGGRGVAEYITGRNNQFADVEAPTDPTTATDTQLQLLGGTPPVYSLDYQDLRINGVGTTVTKPNGADFPGAASESAAASWLRPGGIDWTYGIFEGRRSKPLWFEPAR